MKIQKEDVSRKALPAQTDHRPGEAGDFGNVAGIGIFPNTSTTIAVPDFPNDENDDRFA